MIPSVKVLKNTTPNSESYHLHTRLIYGSWSHVTSSLTHTHIPSKQLIDNE